MAVEQTYSDGTIYSRRQEYERLRGQLDRERQSFKNQWRDANDYILPRRARFFVSDANKGDRRNTKILDTTATLAARTLRAGMMSGITSPARPWFKLGVPDPDLNEFAPVKQWLQTSTQRMQSIFLKSNLYNVLPIMYGDIGCFATAAMSMEPDVNGVMRFYPFPIGSYMIANNDKLMVDVFMREFRMTVRQIIGRFGVDPNDPTKIRWDNISTKVKALWDTNNPEAWIDCVHVIKPNPEWNPNRLESRFKKYISVYYEHGHDGNNGQGQSYGSDISNKFLSEKGFDFFPILTPRWEITGEDVYGTECPGFTAIGDIKQLQTGERRSLQAIEKMINPPMIAPTSLRNAKASTLPGDITYVDVRDGMQGFRAAHEVRFDVNAMESKQGQVRERISRAFYEDLFLMLAQSDRRQITAREIEERHEEKLLALGPVLEQLNQDMLDPLIDNAFNMMVEREMLPPPPDELQGMELKVEYISIMAQAQKLAGLGGIERFTSFSANVIAQSPETADKIDTDQLLDVYSDLTSVPPGIVRTDEQVAEIRAQRAQAQAQQQQMMAAQEMASTAKTLSEADTGGDSNALQELIG
jgi:hypothetical protein